MTTGQQKAYTYREEAEVALSTARLVTEHLFHDVPPMMTNVIQTAAKYVGPSGFPVSGDELARMTR